MLGLFSAGTVPILVDHEVDDKVITDSADIVKYINDVYKPQPDMHVGEQCEYIV